MNSSSSSSKVELVRDQQLHLMSPTAHSLAEAKSGAPAAVRQADRVKAGGYLP